MTVAVDIIAIAQPEDLDEAQKRKVQHAIAQVYECLRDLPEDQQARVLIAGAVLLGRADDIVARLTGKKAT